MCLKSKFQSKVTFSLINSIGRVVLVKTLNYIQSSIFNLCSFEGNVSKDRRTNTSQVTQLKIPIQVIRFFDIVQPQNIVKICQQLKRVFLF